MTANNKEMEPEQTGGIHYFQEQISANVHHFYITGEIGPAVNYIEMIHAIRSAGANDVIKLHINSTGGHLDTGIQIINALRESAGHIITILEAQAYSMGSLIFLSGDEFIVHDNAMMMIHNFSGGVFGKGHEQRSRLDAVSDWFETFAESLYIPFISPEELSMVIDGKDMWMHPDDIETRLRALVKHREMVMMERVQMLEDPDKVGVKKKKASKKKVGKSKS